MNYTLKVEGITENVAPCSTSKPSQRVTVPDASISYSTPLFTITSPFVRSLSIEVHADFSMTIVTDDELSTHWAGTCQQADNCQEIINLFHVTEVYSFYKKG